MRFPRCLFLVPLLLLLVGCASGTSAPSSQALTPAPTIADTPTPPNVEERSVSFTTSDHEKLAGSLFGHGKTMVICSHMNETNSSIWRNSGIPQRLAAMGYEVLAYDFRGDGASDGDPDTTVLDVDLSAAVNFAHQQGATKIVLMGASMGGTASLNVATKTQVAAVISLSGPQSFGVNVTDDEVKALKAPKLFIASEDDEPFASDARHMYNLASSPKELYIYPGNAHGTDIFGGDNGDAPAQRVLHFITQYAPTS